MKSIKSLIIIFIVASMIVAGGCSGNIVEKDKPAGPGGVKDETIMISATLYPQFDFARIIGGEKADVSLVLPPGMEAHSFEPTPQEIVSLSRTDIFLYTGDDMEPWAGNIVENLKNEGVFVLDLSRGIPMLEMDDHGHENEGTADGHENEERGVDPHYWTDPNMAIIMIDEILQAMVSIDPDNEEYYSGNSKLLKESLLKLDKDIKEVVEGSSSKTILSGGHFAFGYFAHRYGLEHMSPYEGFSPNAEPSPKSIASLMETIKSTGARAIFFEELADPKVARVISEETGIQMLLLHGVHNVSIEDLNSGKSYLDFMYDNLENLKIGLGYDE